MYALALLLLTAADAPQVRVVAGIVEIAGVEKDALRELKALGLGLSKACKLVVGEGTPEEIAKRQAVAGTWTISENALRFEPQFPLVPGVKYQIRIDSKPQPIVLAMSIAKPPPGPPTRIAAVFPSANILPENTLRLYVHFSGQMTRGNIYRHVKLIRDDGREVKRPFLELDEELWSSDGLRATLFFDPGRVKRELVPREQDGPILEEGHTYALVFSREWQDAEGRPFPADFKKTFRVGPPDESAIDLGTWSLMAPRAGSDAPLILRLGKPLDRALLGSTISILDASGKSVPGETTVGGGERVATFAPAQPWKAGEYRLVVDPRLEDACGNRVGEPFEVHLAKPKNAQPISHERRFHVK